MLHKGHIKVMLNKDQNSCYIKVMLYKGHVIQRSCHIGLVKQRSYYTMAMSYKGHVIQRSCLKDHVT